MVTAFENAQKEVIAHSLWKKSCSTAVAYNNAVFTLPPTAGAPVRSLAPCLVQKSSPKHVPTLDHM